MELEKINKLPILEKTVVLAYRDTLTDCTAETLKRTADKILEDFPNVSKEELVEGIRKGLKGEYGIPLKVSPAIVSYWITQYIRTEKSKSLLNFKS